MDINSLQSLAFEALTSPDPISGYSVLLTACDEGNCEVVRNILSFSPSLLDILIALQTPALASAGPANADKRPVDIAKALGTPPHQAIQKMLEPHVRNMENNSLIHLAARHGTVHHIRKLIARGADVCGSSHYEKDEYSTPLCLAAAYNKTEVVEELFANGAKPHKRTVFNRGFNAAHFAAKSGNTKNLLYLLEKDNKLKNICFDNSGVSLMHLAACGGHTNTVAALVEVGLDVNGKVEDISSDEEEDSDAATESDYSYEECESEYEYIKDMYDKDFDIFVEQVTPLMLAAKNGNTETADLLISKGAKIHFRDKNNCSALFYACNGGQFLMTQFLIHQGLEVRSLDSWGMSLLHVVTDVKIADLLISEYGLDINACDGTWYRKTPLHYAAECGDIKLVELLLKYGANVNALDVDGENPLVTALTMNNCKTEMLSLLLQKGSKFEIEDCISSGYYHSSSVGPDVAKFLIEAGYSVNAKDFLGRTLLHIAAGFNFETSKLLVEMGAVVNVQDGSRRLPLHEAAKNKQTDTVQLLLKRGSDIDVGDENGESPLFLAVQRESPEMVTILLENTQNIYLTNQWGDSVLHAAVVAGNIEIVQSLLNHEFSNIKNAECDQKKDIIKKSLVLLRNNLGNTALHEAVERDHVEITEILLAHGSDVNVRNDAGWTALQYAMENGLDIITGVLQEHDANTGAGHGSSSCCSL